MIRFISSLLILAGVVVLSGCKPDPYQSYTIYSQAMPGGVIVPAARPVELAASADSSSVALAAAQSPRHGSAGSIAVCLRQKGRI